jgi:hypothetical protein
VPPFRDSYFPISLLFDETTRNARPGKSGAASRGVTTNTDMGSVKPREEKVDLDYFGFQCFAHSVCVDEEIEGDIIHRLGDSFM